MTVPRFECTDRNIVSVIQRETMMNCIEAVYPVGGVYLNIGGPRGEWAGKSINVDVDRRIENIGTESEGWTKDICACGEMMPIKTNSISKLYSCHSLEHMLDAEGSLLEWHRVLRPAGLMIIIVPLFEFHKHDPEVKTLGNRAPSEHTLQEFREIVGRVMERTGMELLLFNTRKNNFDLDIVLQKKGRLPEQMEKAVDGRNKVEVIKSVLVCPVCKSADVEFEDFTNHHKSKNRMICKSCRTVYTKADFRLDDDKIVELWETLYGYRITK